MSDHRKLIEAAFEERTTITPESADKALVSAIEASIAGLEQGTLRVAEPPGSVVVPGSLPAKDGSYALYAAIIVKGEIIAVGFNPKQLAGL